MLFFFRFTVSSKRIRVACHMFSVFVARCFYFSGLKPVTVQSYLLLTFVFVRIVFFILISPRD